MVKELEDLGFKCERLPNNNYRCKKNYGDKKSYMQIFTNNAVEELSDINKEMNKVFEKLSHTPHSEKYQRSGLRKEEAKLYEKKEEIEKIGFSTDERKKLKSQVRQVLNKGSGIYKNLTMLARFKDGYNTTYIIYDKENKKVIEAEKGGQIFSMVRGMSREAGKININKVFDANEGIAKRFARRKSGKADWVAYPFGSVTEIKKGENIRAGFENIFK